MSLLLPNVAQRVEIRENPSAVAVGGAVAALAVIGGAAWYFLRPKEDEGKKEGADSGTSEQEGTSADTSSAPQKPAVSVPVKPGLKPVLKPNMMALFKPPLVRK